MMRLVLVLAGAAVLAGCSMFANETASSDLPPLGAVQSVDAAPVRAPVTGTCPMTEFQHLVGLRLSEIDARTLPDPYRVLTYDAPRTWRPQDDRLTIRLDETEIVESVTCG
ncbi:hypothetical protein DDZ18_06530 [Marinicauda salina]|uniref:Peptidase inhibitor I78 family protein n=1 Tax=Marinicauda salina TaxID=2135793 RepID=A0A2U2BTK0_9PROT|nr:hypothetical protein [Marinicauda salina]PWE17337.1 hypothetical protein DDZ18_06530 [Marinicauda salina]